LTSLIFCSGYYKAAALTTDKLLQEHQEVNVSKVVFYTLMTGAPNGDQPLIGMALVGNWIILIVAPYMVYHCAQY